MNKTLSFMRRLVMQWCKSISLLQTPALVFYFSIAASCGDPMRSVSSVSSPFTEEVVQVDAKLLKSLGSRHLKAGDRLVLSDSTAASQVDASLLTSRDTTIADVDRHGVLYARSAGNTWLVWDRTLGNDIDSTLLNVDAHSDPESLQDDWVQPTFPGMQVDVRYPGSRSRGTAVAKTWRVEKGGDLQAALDAAQPGDEVVLASGATFVGNFVLPNKSGGAGLWIIIRSETIRAAAGTRMTPELVAGSASVITPNQAPAIGAAPRSHRWRLVGFEVGLESPGIYNYGIMVLGRGDEATLVDQPSEIVLDRMYIHGSESGGTSRCVAFNGRSEAVIDSYLAECHARGYDSQGVAGWSGTGPYLIENNRIEAAGQAVMFGGSDPSIAGVSPSDITIRRNYLYKPLSWANGRWTVKATFELKHARRVLFEGNVLENHWSDAQVGFAILFQALTQDNNAPQSTVRDVTVQNNVIKNSRSGVNMLARYNSVVQTPTSRILFKNNLFQDVGIDPVTGGQGRIFQLLGELEDVTLLGNTATLRSGMQAGQALGLDGNPSQRTVIVNNVLPMTDYGLFGNAVGTGTIALTTYAPGAIFAGNVIPNQPEWQYPSANFFPTAGAPAGDVSTSNMDACTAVRGWLTSLGYDKSIGTDCDPLEAATKNVIKKNW